ncbi:MAG: glycosyltransferase family 9 protein [Nitrospinae bacterium]|nr:glycosyltransferase family 9 protein [Nitrospinota bacterium]
MKFDKKSVKKILVLRYRSIGDLVLCNPALETIRATFPGARIDFVVDEAFESLFYKNPNIDRSIPFSRGSKGEGKIKSLLRELRFILRIRAEKYDMVVDLHCGPRSAMLAWLSGARYRLGYPFRFRNRLFYNIHSPFDDGKTRPNDSHSVNNMVKILSPLDPAEPVEKNLFLTCRDEDRKFASDFLARNGVLPGETVMVIHPGASPDIRRLPVEKMGEVLRWLCNETIIKTVLAGTEAERDFIKQMQEIAGRERPVAIGFTLGQFAALLEAGDMFMGNDSGPVHMAAALKKPVVVFFGPGDPEVWAPWGTDAVVLRTARMECMPCSQYKVQCPYGGNHCMNRIPVEDIKNAVTSLMAKIPKLN